MSTSNEQASPSLTGPQSEQLTSMVENNLELAGTPVPRAIVKQEVDHILAHEKTPDHNIVSPRPCGETPFAG